MDLSTTSALPHDPEPTEAEPLEFADFYRRHFAFVWATTRRLGLDLRAAEDAAQEVFVVAHRRLPQFEGRSSERTWLYSIARHVALRVHRGDLRRDRKVRAFAEHHAASGSESSAFDTLSPHVDAEQVLSRFLDTLELGQRQAFTLHALEGRSDREIAELLEIKLSTARARWRSAKAKFHAFSEGMRGELAQVDRLARQRGSEMGGARQRCWLALAPTWTATDWGTASMGTTPVQGAGLLSSTSIWASKLGVAKAAGAGLGFGLGLTVSVAVGELVATDHERAEASASSSPELPSPTADAVPRPDSPITLPMQTPEPAHTQASTTSPGPSGRRFTSVAGGQHRETSSTPRRSANRESHRVATSKKPGPETNSVTTASSRSALASQLALTAELRVRFGRGDYTGVLQASRAWQAPSVFTGLDTEICAYRAAAFCKAGSGSRGRALARRCTLAGHLGRSAGDLLRRSCEH